MSFWFHSSLPLWDSFKKLSSSTFQNLAVRARKRAARLQRGPPPTLGRAPAVPTRAPESPSWNKKRRKRTRRHSRRKQVLLLLRLTGSFSRSLFLSRSLSLSVSLLVFLYFLSSIFRCVNVKACQLPLLLLQLAPLWVISVLFLAPHQMV